MKKKKAIGIAAGAVVAAAALCLAVWRLWPHSLGDVIGTEPGDITSLSCGVMVGGLDTDGEASMDRYSLPAVQAGEEPFEEMLSILQSCEFRQDFRNLLPGGALSGSSDANLSVVVSFTWGKNAEHSGTLVFLGEESVVSSVNGGSGTVYHPVDGSAAERLAACVEAFGTAQ